jgi:hypothetical protein
MSPRKPPEPEQPPKPGQGAIPPDVAKRLERRSRAIAEATSRPQGKPWDGATYGTGKPPTDEQRKTRAKAIRDAAQRDAQD